MLRVFLVEDESIIRETLRDTVPWTQYGYTFVGEAGDGEMALPLIREVQPDVLITDIRMPFMDGLVLSRRVLQEFPEMKVIIISGYDDFEYAQQAIDIGVAQYLLKPFTKNALLTVLDELRVKIEGELAQRNYLAQFQREIQEYEQYAHRNFFERMVAGRLSVQQIYEQAEKLGLDLRAQSYTVALFSLLPEQPAAAGAYSEPSAQLRDSIVRHLLKYPEYILFRWNLTTYAVLIKGEAQKMNDYIHRCISTVREQYDVYGNGKNWYVAVGHPTRLLSTLPSCFEETSRLWACRYIMPEQHVLMAETVKLLPGNGTEQSLVNLDASKVDPGIILGMLQSAGSREVADFVDEYLHSMGDALQSAPFCQYLMLSIRFTATQFVQTLDVSRTAFLESLNCLEMVGQTVTEADLREYMAQILLRAVELREKAAGNQYRDLLKEAVCYIDAHYQSEDISLNRVAREVNISANYLSAVFSQEMGVTFVEYVTAKRMEKARELLRCTDLRSGEIAAAVGYRDPHYFSFLFKKTQGCTPRDYRAGKGTP